MKTITIELTDEEYEQVVLAERVEEGSKCTPFTDLRTPFTGGPVALMVLRKVGEALPPTLEVGDKFRLTERPAYRDIDTEEVLTVVATDPETGEVAVLDGRAEFILPLEGLKIRVLDQ